MWAELTSTDKPEVYFSIWLELLSKLISCAIQSVLITGDQESGTYTPVAQWSSQSRAVDAERLAEISERVIEQRCGLLMELDESDADDRRFAVAYPVVVDGLLQGVVSLEAAVSSPDDLRPVMKQIQLGVLGLESFFRRRLLVEERNMFSRLKTAIDLFAGVLAEEGTQKAGMAFVTELATRLGADRVSLGILKGASVEIGAMSHSADFSKRMNLIKAIATAMDEAILQRENILYPLSPDGKILITKEHDALSKLCGSGTILTMPLYGNGRYYGALTIERPAERPFTGEDMELCRSIASLAVPVLELKRSKERMLFQHIADSFSRQVTRLFGPKYPGRKIAAITLIALVVFFSFAKGEYRVSADMVLEGTIRRVVVAPFNGYIKQANARPGDVVRKGVVLCSMDDRDLTIEQMNWISQESQLQRQYQEALAKRNNAEVSIIRAKIEQTKAQLKLIESKLQRTKIVSPFEGFIVSGDLSQRLGGAIEQGEVLFEVAPLDSYRVILKVDERQIGDVKEGQKGILVLTALPYQKLDFVVESLTPLSTPLEGKNYFRVEAKLGQVSERLRPGMEGVGKIYIDNRKLISIWTRGLIEWLRLRIWSWWP